MSRIFHPLLFLLARCSRNELIRQIEFLKAENEMLRKRMPGKFVRLKAEERARLMELGKAIGPRVRHLISVVSYDTYLRWLRRAKENHQPKKRGRPRTAESVRDLVVKIGTETGWGYTRVMGEMKKLGVKPPSRSTVKRILKAHKLDPPPKQPGTWERFLQQHAETLWQVDFFSKMMWIRTGLRQFFVLVFLHVGSRRVFAWMQEQAQAFVKHVERERIPTALVMRDRDRNYRKKLFDEVLKGAGCGRPRTVHPTCRRTWSGSSSRSSRSA